MKLDALLSQVATIKVDGPADREITAIAYDSRRIKPGTLFVALKGTGSTGTYLRTRHILAFAAAPLVLGLVLVWPVRLAVHGSDVFRSGGEDTGAAVTAFRAVLGLFGAWALGLLVYGISVVERWTFVRALVSLALMLLGILIVTLPFLIPLSSR